MKNQMNTGYKESLGLLGALTQAADPGLKPGPTCRDSESG